MKRALFSAIITVVLVAVTVPAFAGGRHHGHHGGTPIYSNYNVPGCAINPWLCGGPMYTNPNWGGYGYYNEPIVIQMDLGSGGGGSLSDALGGIAYEGARIPGRVLTGTASGFVDGFTGNNRSSTTQTVYAQPRPVEREVVREVVREVPQEKVAQQPPQQIINNYYYGSPEPATKPKAKKAAKKRYIVEVTEVQYVDCTKRRK